MNQNSASPRLGRSFRRITALASVVCFAAAAIYFSHSSRPVKAADHRDSPTADANPEGDITDVFAFVDPNDSTQLVLAMNVNPFSVPAEAPSYSFSNEFLYQFKFMNDKDAQDDLVIQAKFNAVDTTVCASGQWIKLFGPGRPERHGIHNTIIFRRPTLEGCTNTTLSNTQMKVFTGQRDDPFVTDVGQLFRIQQKLQDVYRTFTSPALGALRGRAVRSDGTSGVDGFGGFNVSSIVIELPKSSVRGAGFLGSTHLIGIWGTVSRPEEHTGFHFGDRFSERFAGHDETSFLQFQRMGQQLFKTIFVPKPQREAFNASDPSNDAKNWSGLVPDALTTSDNDGTGNTIAGRVAVLNAVGVTAPPNGAPLLLPADFGNTTKDLLRIALLPDVLRLDLDRDPADLAIGQFGLQSGRRPADNVTEILMRLARQLADVKFPDGTGLPGSGPLGVRAALDCTVLPACPDRRVLVVLQGTQFLKPDAQLGDLSTSGNDRPLLTAFPFLAAPHPLPGETTPTPGTVGFPPQQ
jgi:uncharacterized protein DUF4331